MCEIFEMQSFCMGTIVTQKVYGKNGKIAAKTTANELKRLESLMSFFLDSSDVSKLNRAAGESEIKVSFETLSILKTAKLYSKICNGTFDVTIAPLVKLWGIFTEHQKVPSETEINNLLQLINYDDILIDDDENTVKLQKNGQMIDLGAIAKGYAADRAIEIYKSYGIQSGFINIGGNVQILGDKPDNSSWMIGLQNPIQDRGECLGVITTSNKTVVTSGDYVRYFKKEGIRYHHILDPRTGYPANSDLLSTTIITKSSIAADALSTATFILGLEQGKELLDQLEDTEAVFITKDKQIYITRGLKENFVLLDDTYEWRQ